MEVTIFNTLHPDVEKRKNTVGLTISTCMLLVGSILLFLSFYLEKEFSVISMSLLTGAVILLLTGIFRLFWRSKQMIYTPSESLVNEISLSYDDRELDKLLGKLKAGDFSPNKMVETSSKGVLHLIALVSQDNKFAALQLFRFINHTYSSLSDVLFYTDNEAKEVADYIKKTRNQIK